MEKLGLVEKFNITRNSKPYPPHGGKHFVMLPEEDPYARVALLAYASSIESENQELAEQIRGWIDSLPRDTDHTT